MKARKQQCEAFNSLCDPTRTRVAMHCPWRGRLCCEARRLEQTTEISGGKTDAWKGFERGKTRKRGSHEEQSLIANV